jgi:hypothetical protein
MQELVRASKSLRKCAPYQHEYVFGRKPDGAINATLHAFLTGPGTRSDWRRASNCLTKEMVWAGNEPWSELSGSVAFPTILISSLEHLPLDDFPIVVATMNRVLQKNASFVADIVWTKRARSRYRLRLSQLVSAISKQLWQAAPWVARSPLCVSGS